MVTIHRRDRRDESRKTSGQLLSVGVTGEPYFVNRELLTEVYSRLVLSL